MSMDIIGYCNVLQHYVGLFSFLYLIASVYLLNPYFFIPEPEQKTCFGSVRLFHKVIFSIFELKYFEI